MRLILTHEFAEYVRDEADVGNELMESLLLRD